MPIITDDLIALLGLVEISSCSCKKECRSNRLSVSKTVLSEACYVNALHARMTEMMQKNIFFMLNQVTISKKLNE